MDLDDRIAELEERVRVLEACITDIETRLRTRRRRRGRKARNPVDVLAAVERATTQQPYDPL